MNFEQWLFLKKFGLELFAEKFTSYCKKHDELLKKIILENSNSCVIFSREIITNIDVCKCTVESEKVRKIHTFRLCAKTKIYKDSFWVVVLLLFLSHCQHEYVSLKSVFSVDPDVWVKTFHHVCFKFSLIWREMCEKIFFFFFQYFLMKVDWVRNIHPHNFTFFVLFADMSCYEGTESVRR